MILICSRSAAEGCAESIEKVNEQLLSDIDQWQAAYSDRIVDEMNQIRYD